MSRIFLIAVSVAVVGLAGCVSQRTHDMKVAELEAQIEGARTAALGAQQKLKAGQQKSAELQTQLDDALASGKELQTQVAAASKEAADYKAKYEEQGGALVERLISIPGVAVSKSGGIQATVQFALGVGDKIDAKTDQNLKELAKGLAGKTGPVYIDGHSDNSPVGSIEARKKYTDNLGLSMARAAAVARALAAAGVPAKNLVVRGWGSERPVAPNDTRAGRARNRRVDVSFVPAPAPAPKPEGSDAKKPAPDVDAKE